MPYIFYICAWNRKKNVYKEHLSFIFYQGQLSIDLTFEPLSFYTLRASDQDLSWNVDSNFFIIFFIFSSSFYSWFRHKLSRKKLWKFLQIKIVYYKPIRMWNDTKENIFTYLGFLSLKILFILISYLSSGMG